MTSTEVLGKLAIILGRQMLDALLREVALYETLLQKGLLTEEDINRIISTKGREFPGRESYASLLDSYLNSINELSNNISTTFNNHK